MSLEFLIYWLMIWRSDCWNTLLVITEIPRGSERIKLTKTSDLVFLNCLLMLATWIAEFFMKLLLLLLLIRTITCFLEGPLVVI